MIKPRGDQQTKLNEPYYPPDPLNQALSPGLLPLCYRPVTREDVKLEPDVQGPAQPLQRAH